MGHLEELTNELRSGLDAFNFTKLYCCSPLLKGVHDKFGAGAVPTGAFVEGRLAQSIGTEPTFNNQILLDVFDDVNNIIPENLYDLIPENVNRLDIELGKSRKQAREVNLSPQVRKIAPGATLYVPLLVVPRNFIFELIDYFHETFTAQGDQDLIFKLVLGNDAVFQSGKINSVATAPPFDDPIFVSETRTTGIIGVPPSNISSTTGVGFPDHYSPTCSGKYGVAGEREAVFFLLTNQSAVYNHGFRVYLRGLAYPVPTEAQ